MTIRAFEIVLLVAALSACVSTGSSIEPFGCRTGAWRLADGSGLTLSRMPDGGLRWRLEDGGTGKLVQAGDEWRNSTGWTDLPANVPATFGECPDGLLSFEGQTAHRLDLSIVETKFKGDGETLQGRLVLPPGDTPVPILVEVHGSERDAATQFNFFQQMAPAMGIGVFVYDKRGTGGSTGQYTQDFSLLAADAAAAVSEARRLAGERALSVGLHGSSQGGWVAPLAARLSPVDFVIVGYGLAVSPLAENRAETIQDVADAGYDLSAQAAAGELADAAGVIMASGFRCGFAELNRLKTSRRNEPWYGHARGEFTGEFVRYPSWMLQIGGPWSATGTTWAHDPEPVLRALDVPILWILAAQDTEAPIEETRDRLLALAAENRPITVVSFPDSEHGMREFQVDETGRRVFTRYSEGYFRIVADWARNQRLSPTGYGRMEVLSDGGRKQSAWFKGRRTGK